jgi:phage-related protein
VKDVVLVGRCGDDLRGFPDAARQRAGYQLYLVQIGLEPADWKPIPTVGPGAREIRICTGTGAYRVIYAATIGDAVYVLHCFTKKTQRTAKTDLDLAKRRYQQALERARRKDGT